MAMQITPIIFPKSPTGIEMSFWHHVDSWGEIYPYLKWEYYDEDNEGREIRHSNTVLLCTNRGLIYTTYFVETDIKDESDPDYGKFGINFIPGNQTIRYWAYIPDAPLGQEVTCCTDYDEYKKMKTHAMEAFDIQFVRNYVLRLKPYISDEWSTKYAILWSAILTDKSIVEHIKETRDKEFQLFNKYIIHSIIGLMKHRQVFNSEVTDEQLNMVLEGVEKSNKYRSSISRWTGNDKVKDNVENLIRAIAKF